MSFWRILKIGARLCIEIGDLMALLAGIACFVGRIARRAPPMNNPNLLAEIRASGRNRRNLDFRFPVVGNPKLVQPQ